MPRSCCSPTAAGTRSTHSIPYRSCSSPGTPIFTAAKYPPLYFHLAGIGDPFITGRAVSILASLCVAGAIVWRARAAGGAVAATIGLAWLGSVPVMQWGAALKPDAVALAL